MMQDCCEIVCVDVVCVYVVGWFECWCVVFELCDWQVVCCVDVGDVYDVCGQYVVYCCCMQLLFG